jgi:hypothetical protein
MKPLHLNESWGWFVDIEQPNIPLFLPNRYPRQMSKHVAIPKTIQEYPIKRIPSFLEETIYDIDIDIDENPNTFTITGILFVTGLILLVLVQIL